MIEEIVAGIISIMFFGALIYLFIRYCVPQLKHEKLLMEKKERLYDILLEKYSCPSDINDKV